MGEHNISGVIVAIITPFNDRLSVDRDVLTEHLGRLSKSGVDGYFVCGTTGQGPLLSLSEKLEVLEAVMENSGSRRVIVQVGSLNVGEIVEFGRAAIKMGADALALLPPYYYRYDREAILRFYRLISEKLGTPLFLYNIPSTTGVNVDPPLAEELYRSGSICGVKESSGNVVQVSEMVEKLRGVPVLNGPDTMHYYALASGAAGVVSGVANVIPEVVVEMYRRFKDGDLNTAYKLHQTVAALRRVIEGYPHIAGYHTAIELLGWRAGGVKPPLRNLTVEEERRLEEDLRRLELLR